MWLDTGMDFGNKREKNIKELIYPIILAPLVLIIRHLSEKYIFGPLGVWLGGPVKTPLLTKFTESVWKCLYFTCASLGGAIILWPKPWLWDINECWTDFYNQTVPSDIWWHFSISLTFMWSFLLSLYFDVRRKDFFIMLVHHISVIIFACLCWNANFFRMLSLGLVLHDCCDIFLEGAKIAKYLKCQRMFHTFFVIFTLVWVVTRLGFFPFWIIKNVILDVPKILPNFTCFAMYYIFIAFMFLFLILDFIWTFYIFKMAASLLARGHLKGDARSDDEE
ncbi:ceramide synthase 5-like [Tribolium madens]|uniref:ceramide synthase 5-like n=1 Tax=Tribolium madens TaxID=41895 RepID=UPI001CF73D45|nr:ceramide synthase 5-like [Tribolium madens]